MPPEASTSRLAPSYPIPTPWLELAGIEYPGRVRNTHKALQSLGGLGKVSSSLDKTAYKEHPTPANTIEYNLNPLNVHAHPVPANLVTTGNVVLKLTRRRRKVPKVDADGNVVDSGMFTAEVCGVATKTVRFRAMADYQQYAHPADSVAQLADSIRHFNVDHITSFNFPPPSETYTPDTFIPPPLFSRHNVPQPWDLGPTRASVKMTTLNQRGQEVERYINNSRWKVKRQPTIAFKDPAVPTGPIDKRAEFGPNVPIEAELLRLLAERPMWTRTAITNQLNEGDARVMINQKHALPVTSYTFSDGPFQNISIRYGYDPRTDPEARFFQTIMFRNTDNPYIKTALHEPPARGKNAGARDAFNRHTHEFDGKTVHASIGTFQLVDVTDPLVAGLIRAPEAVAEACSSGTEGWYRVEYFDQIRAVLRRKFTGLLQGREVGEGDCADLLGDPVEMARVRKEAGGKKTGRPRKVGTGERGGAGRAGEGREELASEAVEEEEEEQAGVEMTSEVEREEAGGLESGVEGMSVDGAEGGSEMDGADDDAGEDERRRARSESSAVQAESEHEPEAADIETDETTPLALAPELAPAPAPSADEPAAAASAAATGVAAGTPTRRVTRSGQASSPAVGLGSSAAKPGWLKPKKRVRGGPKKATETEEERRGRLERLIGSVQRGGEGETEGEGEAEAEGEE